MIKIHLRTDERIEIAIIAYKKTRVICMPRAGVRGRQNGAFVLDLMPSRTSCLKFSLENILYGNLIK
jgi:hypothetical protein